MPLFGVRYARWDEAHATPPLPYSEWELMDDDHHTTFEAAKERAKFLEAQHQPHHYVRRHGEYDGWGDPISDYVPIEGANPHYKFMAYKIPECQNWAEREPQRIANGDYELLPEHMRPQGSRYAHMFPRLNPKTKLIQFYASSNEAALDRLTEMKPSRFFSRYTDAGDTMWDWMAELGLISANLTLAFATTREDIRFVYENGPESCMSANARNYGFGGEHSIHPTEAYASPDLELAYLYRGESREDENAIVARALCNAKTKQYVRVYGDIRRMEKMLEEKGYTENQYALGGCRVLKIFAKQRDGTQSETTLMTPYIDGPCCQMELKDPNDDYLVILRPPMVVQGNTGGVAELHLY